MDAALLILFGLVVCGVGCYHRRWWWDLHYKRLEPRTDDQVRDWRDVRDKWWSTILFFTLGIALLVAGVVRIIA